MGGSGRGGSHGGEYLGSVCSALGAAPGHVPEAQGQSGPGQVPHWGREQEQGGRGCPSRTLLAGCKIRHCLPVTPSQGRLLPPSTPLVAPTVVILHVSSRPASPSQYSGLTMVWGQPESDSLQVSKQGQSPLHDRHDPHSVPITRPRLGFSWPFHTQSCLELRSLCLPLSLAVRISASPHPCVPDPSTSAASLIFVTSPCPAPILSGSPPGFCHPDLTRKSASGSCLAPPATSFWLLPSCPSRRPPRRGGILG